jgi:hypothetical protein
VVLGVSSTIQKSTTNDLSSLKTENGTLRTTYSIRSVDAIAEFQNDEGSSSEIKCGIVRSDRSLPPSFGALYKHNPVP